MHLAQQGKALPPLNQRLAGGAEGWALPIHSCSDFRALCSSERRAEGSPSAEPAVKASVSSAPELP